MDVVFGLILFTWFMLKELQDGLAPYGWKFSFLLQFIIYFCSTSILLYSVYIIRKQVWKMQSDNRILHVRMTTLVIYAVIIILLCLPMLGLVVI